VLDAATGISLYSFKNARRCSYTGVILWSSSSVVLSDELGFVDIWAIHLQTVTVSERLLGVDARQRAAISSSHMCPALGKLLCHEDPSVLLAFSPLKGSLLLLQVTN